jgi:hypothetical protein
MTGKKTQKKGFHVFTNAGNLVLGTAEKGVGLAGNVLTRATKGARNIGVGALRVSGKVLRVGTGAANTMVGVPVRLFSGRKRRGRKSTRRRR